MKAQEVVNATRIGGCVKCTSEEYHNGLRAELVKQAGEYLDQWQLEQAHLTLYAIQQFDAMFRARPGEPIPS